MTTSAVPVFTALGKDVQAAYVGLLDGAQDFSQKSIRLFVSSTFTDTLLERNYLMKHTYPQLRDYYRARRLDFVVVDLRWGIRDEATDDHMTTSICMSEIDRCIKGSVATFFIFLSAQKYGWRPLPPMVEADEFDVILAHIAKDDDRDFVREWYLCDKNLVKPIYLLQKISSKIDGFMGADKAKADQASSQWWKTEERLQHILREAVAACESKSLLTKTQLAKWSVSVTEQEVIRGGLAYPNRSICFMRTIPDLENQPGSRLLGSYINCSYDGKVDQKSFDLLNRLRDEVVGVFGKESVWQYTVDWTPQGMTPDDAKHAVYVEKFAQDFKNAVIQKIAQAMALEPLPHPHTVEVLAHGHMCYSRAKIFRGREDILGRIRSYFNRQPLTDTKDFDEETKLPVAPTEKKDETKSPADPNKLLVIFGKSGFGKTSVVAKAAAEAKSLKGNAIVMIRFCGTTPNSSSSFRLIESLCLQLKAIYHDVPAAQFLGEVPGDYKNLIKVFPKWLELSTAERPIIILIDSLDQINDEFASELTWLPSKLPAYTFIVVSSIADKRDCFQELARRTTDGLIPRANFIKVGELRADEAKPIVDSWLANDGKTLQEEQRQELDRVASVNPNALFIRLLYDRVSKWKSFSKVETLETTVSGLVNTFLDRLEKYHGVVFVSYVFGLLAASKYGLSEDELIDMISCQDDVLKTIFQYHTPPQKRIPPLLLIRLKLECGEYMVERGANGTPVLGWYHRQFWEAAQERYFKTAEDQQKYSRIVAEYFLDRYAQEHRLDRGISSQPLWFYPSEGERVLNYRKLTELPNALIHAKMEKEIVDVLSDLLWVEATCIAGLLHELVMNYHQAIKLLHDASPTHPGLERLQAFVQWVKSDADVLHSNPDTTLQQALNKPNSYLVSQLAASLLSTSVKTSYVEWINKPASVSSCELTIKGHTAGVIFCIYVDNNTLLTTSHDRTIRVWNTLTGAQQLCFKSHEAAPQACAVYGNRVLSLDHNYIYLWDINTGTVIAKNSALKGQYKKPPFYCRFSTDGKRFVTTSGTNFWPGNPVGNLTVWDGETGRKLGMPLAFSLDRWVSAVNDTCTLALVGHNTNNKDTFPPLGLNQLELWDISIAKEDEDSRDETACQYVLSPQRQVKKKLPNGRLVSVNYIAQNGSTFLPFGKLAEGHLRCKKQWPMGTHVLFNGNDTYIKPGKPENGEFPFGCCNARLSPSGKLQLGWRERVAYVYDTVAPTFPNMYHHRLAGHAGNISCAAFSPDETHVATTSDDQTTRIWKISKEPHAEAASLLLTDSSVRTYAKLFVSTAGHREVLVIQNEILEVHKVDSDDVKPFEPKHIGYILTSAVTPNGRWAITSAIDFTVALWDVKKGEELQLLEQKEQIMCSAFSPDSRLAVFATARQRLLVYELNESTKQLENLQVLPLPDIALVVAFSPDSSHLAVGTLAGTHLLYTVSPSLPVHLQHVATTPNVDDVGNPVGVSTIAFSGSGGQIAFGDELGSVSVFDIASGKTLLKVRCFVNRVDAVVFEQGDHRLFVSSLEEKRVAIVDVAKKAISGNYTLTIPANLTSIVVDADGLAVVFDSTGRKHHLWLRGSESPNPQSIRPLDLSIKPRWSAEYISGNWFHIQKDLLASFMEGAVFQYWTPTRDPKDKTECDLAWHQSIAGQGATLDVRCYLPPGEYELLWRVKVSQEPGYPLAKLDFSTGGPYVTNTFKLWDVPDQEANRGKGYVEINNGKFTVVRACDVNMKVHCAWLDNGVMTKGYWVESPKVRSVPRKSEPSESIEPDQSNPLPKAEVGDQVTWKLGSVALVGQVQRVHGQFLVAKLLEKTEEHQAGGNHTFTRKEIVHVRRAAEAVSQQQEKIPVVIQINPGFWKSGSIRGLEGESWLLSEEAQPPTKREIKSVTVIEDIPPNPRDIKVLSTILVRSKVFEWNLAVVVEVGSNLETFCVHKENGEERVVPLSELRSPHQDRDQVLKSLQSKLLFLEAFKEFHQVDDGSTAPSDASKAAAHTLIHTVSQSQFEETIATLFSQADVDHSGELSYDEVKKLSGTMGLFMSAASWDKMLKNMDTDGNGSISKSELITYWNKWYTERADHEEDPSLLTHSEAAEQKSE